MKLLFLDVDGVLNRCGKSGHGLEEDKVLLLKRIVDETNCDIILSSTWRKSDRQTERIQDLLRERMGICLLDCTPVSDRLVDGLWRSEMRGVEIKECLSRYDDVESFVILDDGDDMGALLPHLVQTYCFTGLTPEIADEVIRRLNTGKGDT